MGPAVSSRETMKELMLSGMNVSRLNFSHASHKDHKAQIDILKELRKELKQPLAILLDTKGPEIRTLQLENDFLDVKEGDQVVITPDETKNSGNCIPVSYIHIARDLNEKKTILIDDGRVEMQVDKVVKNEIYCTAVNGGRIGSRKGINIPGAKIQLPAISEKDRKDILFGIENNVDFIAASFVRNQDDVLAIRRLLDENGGEDILIIAKIENEEGVENLDSILALSDGVMVARGDLSVETSYEKVPLIQKQIITKSLALNKPAIIATQMLESMIESPRATRAEISDVANAIYDSASTVMLSGETAMGMYPVQCLQTMDKTARSIESNLDYKQRYIAHTRSGNPSHTITHAVTEAAVATAYNINADAILCLTKSGRTAFSVSSLRSGIPIIAATPTEKVYHQLALNWGIIPIFSKIENDFDTLVKETMDAAKDKGILKDGDLVVVAAGLPMGYSGMTNMIQIETVGDVIVRGKCLVGGKAIARVCVCRTAVEAAALFQDGDILIVSKTTEEMLPLIKRSSGIIIAETDTNNYAKTLGQALDIPVVAQAGGAMEIIRNGTTISLDGDKGLISTGH